MQSVGGYFFLYSKSIAIPLLVISVLNVMRILVRTISISTKQNVLGISIPDRRINVLTTSPNQNPTYDTQEEVSATHECKDCVVVFDDVLERNQFKKLLPVFLSAVNMKTLMCHMYHNDILNYRY